VGKPEEKRPRKRPRHGGQNNIKIGLREMGLGHGLVRFVSGEGQVAGSRKRGGESLVSIKFGESAD
jgi:hypothetical protein